MKPVQDAAFASAFLSDRYGNRASAAEEIGRGDWSVAYGFTLDGAELVVRFAAKSDDFEKDRIASAYAAPGLPIPRVVEIGEAPGGFFAISERAHGAPLEARDEAGMCAMLPAVFAAHDAMRLADVSHSSGYGAWGAGGDAPYATWQEALLAPPGYGPDGRIDGWRERLAAYPEANAAFAEASARLRELAPALPSERYLVHSDPVNRNILVADGRITAVLDWGCAMYGDFLYDLAHLTFLTCWFPAWSVVDFATAAERHYAEIGLNVPAMGERLRCYEIHIGLHAIAYNAFRQRPPEMLDLLSRRTLQAARG